MQQPHRKHHLIALILTLIVPGLGAGYAGVPDHGVLVFGACAVCATVAILAGGVAVVLPLAAMAGALVHAGMAASAWNRNGMRTWR